MKDSLTWPIPNTAGTAPNLSTTTYVFNENQAFCAHRSGIEHVEVTQPQGAKYEFWRCIECQCEFRPTGGKRP